MVKIKVLDSLMGAGKTSHVIEMIRQNPAGPYIYITPYLKEIRERILKEFPDFQEPKENNLTGEVKLDHLNQLLKEGKNVASTHALFKRINAETIQYLKMHNYTLIIDEVVEVVSSEDFKKDDLKLVVDGGLARVNEKTGHLEWICPEYNGKLNRIKQLCMTKSVIVVDDTALVWVFPPDIFSLFKEVYVCTYLFEAQVQRFYFDLYKIPYERFRVVPSAQGGYSTVPHDGRPDKVNQLPITIYLGKKNEIGKNPVRRVAKAGGEEEKAEEDNHYPMSATWYSKASPEKFQALKTNLTGFFKNDAKTGVDLNLWTCIKGRVKKDEEEGEYQKKLKGKGYTGGFLACNARASNDYRYKTSVAFAVNAFMDPYIVKFFQYNGISITKEVQEQYALSFMLQFLFRSAIREGKPILVYVPPQRMRNLLQKWLGRLPED